MKNILDAPKYIDYQLHNICHKRIYVGGNDI